MYVANTDKHTSKIHILYICIFPYLPITIRIRSVTCTCFPEMNFQLVLPAIPTRRSNRIWSNFCTRDRATSFFRFHTSKSPDRLFEKYSFICSNPIHTLVCNYPADAYHLYFGQHGNDVISFLCGTTLQYLASPQKNFKVSLG